MHAYSPFNSVGNFQGRKNINIFQALLHDSCFQKGLHTAIPLDKTHYEFPLILVSKVLMKFIFSLSSNNHLSHAKKFPTTVLTTSANNDNSFSLASLFKISLYISEF